MANIAVSADVLNTSAFPCPHVALNARIVVVNTDYEFRPCDWYLVRVGQEITLRKVFAHAPSIIGRVGAFWFEH